MPSASKRKGNNFELEIVKELQANGFESERAWGSDGRSFGNNYASDVDVRAVKDGKEYRIQAKRRKSSPQWLHFGTCDLVIFRADREDTIVFMKLKDWLNER